MSTWLLHPSPFWMLIYSAVKLQVNNSCLCLLVLNGHEIQHSWPKRHDPCFHVFLMEAEFITFLTHCTLSGFYFLCWVSDLITTVSQNGDPEKRTKHRTLPAWRRSASNAADWRPLGGVTDRLGGQRVYPLAPTPMEASSRSRSPSASPTPTPPPPPDNAHLLRRQLAYDDNADVTRSSEDLGRCGLNGNSSKNLIRDENQNQPRLKATLLRKAHSQVTNHVHSRNSTFKTA